MIAYATACAVSAGGIWKTPKPRTGICTPLFKVKVCMVMFPINGQLTIHHPLRGGGVAVADDFNTAQGIVQFAQIGGSQSNVCGGKVFFQAVLLGRAGNRHNPRPTPRPAQFAPWSPRGGGRRHPLLQAAQRCVAWHLSENAGGSCGNHRRQAVCLWSSLRSGNPCRAG